MKMLTPEMRKRIVENIQKNTFSRTQTDIYAARAKLSPETVRQAAIKRAEILKNK